MNKQTKQYYLTRLALYTALLGAVVLSGCNKQNSESNLPVKEVEITANDQMKFSIDTIQVAPGQQVKLKLANVGSMPKESMGHNWVLLEKNTDPAKFTEGGFAYASNSYISPEMESKVLAKTKILGPGESETITFTAPSSPAVYTYICAFPGHFAAGMKGTLIVQ